jgi:hypothetical protein
VCDPNPPSLIASVLSEPSPHALVDSPINIRAINIGQIKLHCLKLQALVEQIEIPAKAKASGEAHCFFAIEVAFKHLSKDGTSAKTAMHLGGKRTNFKFG